MKQYMLIVLVALGVIILVPGLAQSLASFISGSYGLCTNEPYNPSCYCLADYNKISTRWGNYYCEPSGMVLDPSSTTFNADAIAYAQAHIAQQYPNCNTLYACPTQNNPWNGPHVQVSEYGTPGNEARHVIVECRNEYQGKVATWWEMDLNLETGQVVTASCYDYINNWWV